MIYGTLPRDLGMVDLSPAEMMFWLYCPIKTPRTELVLPANLRQFLPIVLRAKWEDAERFRDSYVYLTAKTLYATPDCVGNRPGWHSDGFGTDDLNYIWYDRAPTEFIDSQKGFPLPDDCDASMDIMAWQAAVSPLVTFPDKHLLRLTSAAIHRCPVAFDPGVRTFVKVSISADRYDLAGNSLNHDLGERWPLHARQAERNHPSTRTAA